MSDTKLFLVLGHGHDNLIEFDERPTLPKGYTLVLFTECGLVSYLETTVADAVNAFSEPSNREILTGLEDTELKTLFKNNPPHIIHEGEKYPDLWCEFFLDWSTANRTKHTAVKSGLYKFPLSGTSSNYTKKRTINVIPSTLVSVNETNISQIKELYEQSIFPSSEYIDDILSSRYGRYLSEFRKKMYFPISDIFKAGGPGIYYWPLCRSNKNTANIEDYIYSLDDLTQYTNRNNYRNIKTELKAKYTPYIHQSKIENADTVKRFLNENIKNTRLPNHFKKHYILPFKNKYSRLLNKTTRIRRRSVNQRNKTKKRHNA